MIRLNGNIAMPRATINTQYVALVADSPTMIAIQLRTKAAGLTSHLSAANGDLRIVNVSMRGMLPYVTRLAGCRKPYAERTRRPGVAGVCAICGCCSLDTLLYLACLDQNTTPPANDAIKLSAHAIYCATNRDRLTQIVFSSILSNPFHIPYSLLLNRVARAHSCSRAARLHRPALAQATRGLRDCIPTPLQLICNSWLTRSNCST